MSIQAIKVAISLPKKTMREIEDLRHQLGLGRSQAILEAVSLWLKKRQEEAWDRKCAESYKKYPENSKEIHAFYKAGLASFSKDKW